jgi:hypothetical protein
MFGQVEFKVAGVYYIEVSVDDVLKIRYPLVLKVMSAPQANPEQPPEAASAP